MSLYRCSECGHGRYLTAWAQACLFGPLGADGELLQHDDVMACFLFVDSIACERHIDARIETKIGSRFCVWKQCDKCKGEGKTPYTYRCADCGGVGGEWVLPDAAVVA